jgi:hypothetical protein
MRKKPETRNQKKEIRKQKAEGNQEETKDRNQKRIASIQGTLASIWRACGRRRGKPRNHHITFWFLTSGFWFPSPSDF